MFQDLREYLLEYLPQIIVKEGYDDYEIFGKKAERPISDVIEQYLKEKKISYKPHRAKNKNEFPDLRVTIRGTNYAFEHKAGIATDGPNNDLGTLNAYSDKMELYGDNIYCTFVKYSKNDDNKISIQDIYFDKIYRFVGHGSANKGYLKYRKKDGNLRPKVWNDFSKNVVYFDDLKSFKKALKITTSYRAEQLVYQHLQSLELDSIKRIQSQISILLEDK